jgi:hypothetical protein
LEKASASERVFSIVRKPHFIQSYVVSVKQEAISRSIPLLKVEAISRNSNNSINMIYSILNDEDGVFNIDPLDGFIYANRDSGLVQAKSYSLTVITFL